MGIFTRFREDAGVVDSDPLMIGAAAEAYNAASIEAHDAKRRIDQLVEMLQPKVLNERRRKLAEVGDFAGVSALDEEIRELQTEAQVRNVHRNTLERNVQAASEHLNRLQRRKIEVEQASAVAALDKLVPGLLAVLDAILAAAEPFDEASRQSIGGSMIPLVVRVADLRAHAVSTEPFGWRSLVDRAARVLDNEPDAAAIVAFNGTREGRPAAHTGIFG